MEGRNREKEDNQPAQAAGKQRKAVSWKAETEKKKIISLRRQLENREKQ